MTKARWTDSLGHVHQIPCDLLAKGGIGAFAAPPPPCAGAFRLLVDELLAFRERRRRMAAKVKVPTNTRDPKAEKQAEHIASADHMPTVRPVHRPKTGTVKKSFATMTDELNEMVNTTRAQTEEIQRQTAIQMFADLNERARAGRLGSIEAAKVDALQHRHATALGLERTGVRE